MAHRRRSPNQWQCRQRCQCSPAIVRHAEEGGGVHQVWGIWCGTSGVGRLVWSAWCGAPGVERVVWSAWCGAASVVRLVWCVVVCVV
eukprot:359426-Chlamydomonas_euryale.AAC.8